MTHPKVDEAKDKMHKAVVHLQDEFGAIRTGRAVARARREVEGRRVRQRDAARAARRHHGTRSARSSMISPYDKGTLKSIEKAIQASDLGVNPSNDGAVIRITFPELTGERRKDLVKVVKKLAEEARVAVRNVRRHIRQELERDSDISEDDVDAHREGAREAHPRRDRRDRHAARAQGKRAARGLNPARGRRVAGGLADGRGQPLPWLVVHEGEDSNPTAATPVEGVRIIGAEEAQAAANPDPDAPIDPTDTEPGDRRRNVGFPEEGPSWSATEVGDAPPAVDAAAPEPPTGEVPPLPHWTEPPTGAVPAIFTDDSAEHDKVDDDLEAWATITGNQTRFRAEGSDWADADYAADLSGEHEKLGALDEQGPVDEEAEFAEALAAAARRAARTRTRAKATPRTAPRQGDADGTPPGPAAARDLPTAIMTAAAIVVIALVCFQYATWTAVLAAVIIGIATAELCNTLQSRAMRPATLLALVGSVTLPLAAKHYGPGAFPRTSR